MMTSSNGNISHAIAHLWGNSSVTGEFPSHRPVTRSFDVFFDLHPNERLSKQSWGWWFETPSRSLIMTSLWWCCYNVMWCDLMIWYIILHAVTLYELIPVQNLKSTNFQAQILQRSIWMRHAWLIPNSINPQSTFFITIIKITCHPDGYHWD